MSDKIFIASDHAAFWQKKFLIEKLNETYDIEDLGTNSEDSVHYPHYAITLAKHVLENAGSRGILLCGSGIGVSIVANRFKGIRAALCRDLEDAELSRKHNNSNVLCLGGRKTSEDDLYEIAKVWLNESFEGDRHQTRIEMFDQLGQSI